MAMIGALRSEGLGLRSNSVALILGQRSTKGVTTPTPINSLISRGIVT